MMDSREKLGCAYWTSGNQILLHTSTLLLWGCCGENARKVLEGPQIADEKCHLILFLLMLLLTPPTPPTPWA